MYELVIPDCLDLVTLMRRSLIALIALLLVGVAMLRPNGFNETTIQNRTLVQEMFSGMVEIAGTPETAKYLTPGFGCRHNDQELPCHVTVRVIANTLSEGRSGNIRLQFSDGITCARAEQIAADINQTLVSMRQARHASQRPETPTVNRETEASAMQSRLHNTYLNYRAARLAFEKASKVIHDCKAGTIDLAIDKTTR